MIVVDAEAKFTRAFVALEKKYELTYGEMFKLLSNLLARLAANAVSDERKE